MEQAKVAEAARLLVEARRTGRRIAELPRDCKPATAADANQIIDAISEALDEAVAGWKITFLYKPREKPFRCPLFASRVFASPAQIPQSLTPSLCIEPEVTFRATRDLPPRAAVYRAEEVATAVEACPSFEVVDTRFDTSNRTIRQMLNERASLIEAYADHITSGAFIVGPALKDWRDLDFARMRVTMRKDDALIVETDGGHAFIDPFLPVVVMVNELRHGPGLKAGQIVATGSFSGFFPVALGQRITAEFAGLGRVEAMFVK
jgi:2-keto-4-pentenoate hydratase